MSLGKEYFLLHLSAMSQVAGDATNNDVVGTQPVLPMRGLLVDALISAQAVASSKTALISVYAGTTEVVDQVTLNSTTLSGTGTLIAAYKGKVYARGTVFKLKEECEASSNIDGLGAVLLFKSYEKR